MTANLNRNVPNRSDYRTTRVRAGLATGALLSLTLGLMMAPVGLGSHASSITMKAPYHGAVSPSISLSQSSCATANTRPAWGFSLASGTGGGNIYTRASACPSSLGGSLASSYAWVSTGFEAGIPLKMPHAGASSVAVAMSASYRAQGGAWTGSKTGSCAAALTSSSTTYVEYYDGTNWSSTVPPGGPAFNSSTYYIYEPDSYSYGYCYSEASAYVYVDSWVQDTSNGSYIYSTGGLGTTATVVDQFTEVYNDTSWGCYNYTLWDFGTWYNASQVCYNYNVTTTSLWDDYVSGATSASSSFSNSGTTSGPAWYNWTYLPSHHYVWIMDVYASAYSYAYGWRHGSAMAQVNMASNGNGMTVSSITIS